jgi:hypothetical protein
MSTSQTPQNGPQAGPQAGPFEGARHGPPIVEDDLTPAQRIGLAKARRHADAVAAGEMTYKDIAMERQAEWAAHVAKLPDADRARLNDWATRQEAQHGSGLGVVFHHAVPWPLVFMAARYGEEVAHWPTALTDADRARLDGLERGGKPLKFVTTLAAAEAEKKTGKRVHLFIHRPNQPTAPRQGAK